MMATRRIDQLISGSGAQLIGVAEARGPSRVPPDRAAELLATLSALAVRVASVDVANCEGSPATLLSTVGEVRGAVERCVELLLALDRLHELPSKEDIVTEVEPEAPERVRLVPLAAPRVGDMCFAGTLELNRALRELSRAHDEAELLIAVETACRKLRRAIDAVIAAANAGGPVEGSSGEHQRRPQSTDLLSALAVRKLYAGFRRSLRRPSDESPAAVLTALRYAAGALATLVGSPEYAGARLSDRALLRRLRERLLSWARGDQSGREGLQLLGDVRTCADLLRGVNRRQELRAHDETLLRTLLQGPGDDPSAWLRSCEGLSGLDDELDRLLGPARPTAASEQRIAEVLARLAQLQ